MFIVWALRSVKLARKISKIQQIFAKLSLLQRYPQRLFSINLKDLCCPNSSIFINRLECITFIDIFIFECDALFLLLFFSKVLGGHFFSNAWLSVALIVFSLLNFVRINLEHQQAVPSTSLVVKGYHHYRYGQH